MGVIYSLRFHGSLHRYVGSTKNMRRRESSHLWLLRNGIHHCRALQNAADKYGLENMIIDLLQIEVREEWLIPAEQHWLDHFVGRLYNRLTNAAPRKPSQNAARPCPNLIGNQNRKGVPHSPVDKAKISAGLKRAFAEGRRKHNHVENFSAYREAVAAGSICHPARRKPEMIRSVLEHLALTRSVKNSGSHFKMTGENMRVILRNASDILDQTGKFSPAVKCARRKFIHPDWLDLLEA